MVGLPCLECGAVMSDDSAALQEERARLLARETALEREVLTRRHHITYLEQVIARQRRKLAARDQGWCQTKLHLLREIEFWRAKATGEVPTFGRGAKFAHITSLEAKCDEMEEVLQCLHDENCANDD